MIIRPVSRDGHAPILRRKLYQDVMDRLLDLIEQRRLRPGDTLPSERELMDLYGVGRPAIREAIQTAPETQTEGQLEVGAHALARIRLAQ